MILEQASQDTHAGQDASTHVRLRAVPYPYRAMLAICSDLDETLDRRVYWEIASFLNTTGETAMGPGVGLEVGNTIYFDMPPNQFAYWNTDDAGRDMVRTLIRSGHIDCLHSYGDLATTRDHVGRALDELVRHDCWLETWIDHGTAATNFDPDIMAGHGDDVEHEAYHADLTTDYGVKYVWRGRVTSVTGQDVPMRLNGIFNAAHPAASGRTLLKEAVKQILARTGNAKYAMHGPNETWRQATLRDGRCVCEFIRCNPHWGGVSSCDQGRAIGGVLTKAFLDRLVEREGTCILYTHLGKIDDPEVPFNAEAIKAFRQLGEEARAGRILITTTRRLLGYRRAIREVVCESRWQGQTLCVDIRTPDSNDGRIAIHRSDLDGMTFYVPDAKAVCVSVDGRPVQNPVHNAPDSSGQASVSLPWPQLEFPQI